MELRPRYNQPFTLSEAILLDISTISEEITRLQYSIKRLRETQETLQEVIDEAESPGAVDVEIVQAFKENQEVIGSQEERILILKLALADKGVSSGAHYDVDTSTQMTAKSPPHDLHFSEDHNGSGSIEEDDSGGLHL
ncbi:hypothetical protein C8J55DRAFT_512228 [Lentinula edodes]|uniref:Uncharacterized protein n=1 Tax=Lentinula lateritia TaxID=40482 RepID=A0A9W9DQN8_9AGAR|nr:hypothetical protein C8J55DRAFT_512228 [Lentinula edodes]